jgi:hypothetical protein
MGNQDSVPTKPSYVVKKKVQKISGGNISKIDPSESRVSERLQNNGSIKEKSIKPSNIIVKNIDGNKINNLNNSNINNNLQNIDNEYREYQEFLKYKEMKNNNQKNTVLREDKNKVRELSNESLMTRNLFDNNNINKKNYSNTIIDYPTTSNIIPKPNLDNLEFTPYNYNEESSKFKKNLEDERIEFESQEKKRRQQFNNKEEERLNYFKQISKKFEEKYNPWKILELPENNYDISLIKKAYKKMALKYHPDKAGEKYNDIFQVITQSYIYLLSKAEENNELDIKINKKVEKIEYNGTGDIDELSGGVENIYIDKDKFNINTFNKIFDKYKIPDAFDDGYADLMKCGGRGGRKEDNSVDKIENDCIFGKKFNNDIFNSHFDEKKKTNLKKRGDEIIQWQEPDAGDLSSKFNVGQLGVQKVDNFGYSNNNNLSYTDYKTAHLDENLLIDVSKVNYKTYNSIDQLENERSQLSYQQSSEDRMRFDFMERKKLDDEKLRSEQLRAQDEFTRRRFSELNQRLIVHK